MTPAEPADLAALASIEDAADQLLLDHLGAEGWGSPPTGAERASQTGFLIVARDTPSDPVVVGFAHVLELEGGAHLEQLSVLPDHGRRGIGRALVTAAIARVRRQGHQVMTLRTYRDVPFNAPFYASCGFVESEPATPWRRALVTTEDRIGLTRCGPRVEMTLR